MPIKEASTPNRRRALLLLILIGDCFLPARMY
jgi:hypothetical protein